MKQPKWWRNPRVRAVLVQIVFCLVVLWSFLWLFANTTANLNERGIQTSMSFLDQVAPFQIGFSPFIEYVLGTSTYMEVFFIGLLNTLLVSVLGIIAATLLGFLVGVLRLSPNWLVAKIANSYIEALRNIPLLLQLFFWNFAVFLPSLPGPRQSLAFADAVFLNNRGLYIPGIEFTSGLVEILFFASMAAGVLFTILYRRRARQIQRETGKPPRVFWVGVASIFGLPILVLLFGGGAIEYDVPELKKFDFEGGLNVPLALFVLWFGLTVYTSAFIAENVRGGISAVSHGQTEAARSLWFTRGQMLRLIIIPQAMRVIIPPTISQYLNLTKNSSLAVAVSYEEIVAIWAGISLAQTGQALIIIGMTILVYETMSLGTSAVLNWYNKRVQLVER